MYNIVIKFHLVISIVFLLLALVVITWSIVGWTKNLEYKHLFSRLSYFFILFLYLQFFSGLILYFFLKPEKNEEIISLSDAMEQSKLRFWAIEHVALMLFALILSQIGWVMIKQLPGDKRKFRTAGFYYGVSFVLVLLSAAIAIFK